ncbi:hypothetical protein ACTVZO_41705 [Streptomyces sp. IBSNAI002]|uniref:hypothetical protein n=1 Tax=Streptomyces sp. IBSNAI002 TaxID=3457500 RepID=UPI003FD537D0
MNTHQAVTTQAAPAVAYAQEAAPVLSKTVRAQALWLSGMFGFVGAVAAYELIRHVGGTAVAALASAGTAGMAVAYFVMKVEEKLGHL